MNEIEESLLSFRNNNKNDNFTLIARDCIGGILYHQLGLRFLSPTINLFFTPSDFNYFVLYLKNYIDGELVEIKEEGVSYPIGLIYPKGDESLKPIRVDFMHYDSFTNAKDKWEERKKRINYNNIYVVSSFCYPGEIKTLSQEVIDKWNEIKYKKVLFVNKHYGFDDECVLSRDRECEDYAYLLFQYDKVNKWKRTFNKFDFIKFLNS